MMSRLVDCKIGSKVKIAEIDAGYGAIRNLTNLGLIIGNVIEVERKSPLKGPVVVRYSETEIAIGHGLAEKIFVEGI